MQSRRSKKKRCGRRCIRRRLAEFIDAFERLENRRMLAVDFGDAPDTSGGTGAGDYQTLLANGGPSHTIDVTQATLFLGHSVDADSGSLQSKRANADDIDGALTDDEDGVLAPANDLLGTIGSAPTVTLLVTNTTDNAATLAGWIDSNANGLFEVAERASATIGSGTSDVRVTLTFPTIPSGFTGTTYARFRLSTDAAFVAVPSATDPATDGEVEDYAFTITTPAGQPVTVDNYATIDHAISGGGDLLNTGFGTSIAPLGDLNGDGVADLAVARGTSYGSVSVLFMESNELVRSVTTIGDDFSGGPPLNPSDFFGTSMAAIGDLDRDGVADLAVGAIGDDTGGTNRGAVYVLFMNTNGSVKKFTKIASDTGGGATLANTDNFGSSVTSLGDLDGDGIADLAVGAKGDDSASLDSGAVHVLFMNTDGTAKSSRKIVSSSGGGPALASGDRFGVSLASVKDLDGDGVVELAVGATGDDTNGTDRGALYVLLLSGDGSVKGYSKIASNVGSEPALLNSDNFGSSVTSIGDLDADGVTDLAVGAAGDDTNGGNSGAAYILLLNANGTVKGSAKIAKGIGGGPNLNMGQFGASFATMGDLNDDGVVDLAVGAIGDFPGPGALFILKLSAPPGFDYGDAPDTTSGTGEGDYQTLAANGGPIHRTIAGLFLGGTVDSDDGMRQNLLANADDTNHALPDDEDGVLISATELMGTVGTSPRITLSVTNATGTAATLAGWIDYNHNGLFETSERATTTVNASTTNGRAMLTFPTIPARSVGKTYARFRLSTDESFVAAPSATGAVDDGEVEDHVFSITNPAFVPITVEGLAKIASGTPAGPTLANNDRFGASVTSIGDLDGDGVTDLAVGAPYDDTNGADRGAVHVLLLNADGTVKNSTNIASGVNGGPNLANGDRFGFSVASLGDLDGDGVGDLAVGAPGNDTPCGTDCGAVYVLRLNANGTAKVTVQSIRGDRSSQFLGTSLAALGDINDDGVTDLAVGLLADQTSGTLIGAVWLVPLSESGLSRGGIKRISSGVNGAPTLFSNLRFGRSLASVGDLDGNGVNDLAAGLPGSNINGTSTGALYILFLNTDGTVKSFNHISNGSNQDLILATGDNLGISLSAVGDVDGDGVIDLAVGAFGDNTGGADRGAVYVMLLNASGQAKSIVKIASDIRGGPTLASQDYFGSSVASLGDLDGDGVVDLAVGAMGDDAGGSARGAVHLLRFTPARSDFGDAPDGASGVKSGDYQTTFADGGPSHLVVPGLFLGDTVDIDSGSRQNVRAHADDVDSAQPDDEDGVLAPATDLIGTIGAAPTVTLLVTNTTGQTATLAGWIDTNNNGLFETFERATTTVNTGLTDSRVTLTFPIIASGFTGTTYARFRLSTDATFVSSPSSTGLAGDGEVEDYTFTITAPSHGAVKSIRKIASGLSGGPNLANFDYFGRSVASIGDLDGDGVADLAVGAFGDDTGGISRGAIRVLYMNADGTVKSSVKIASGVGGGPTLGNFDYFGTSVASMGDMDGDGVADLAVGASGDDTGGLDPGAVYVLLMNTNGTVKSTTKIASGIGGGPTLVSNDFFGSSVASIGDLDGDGVADLAVGATGDDLGGLDNGAVYILLLNANGTVKSSSKIASGTSGGPTLVSRDRFGMSVATAGDLDGDGVTDLAVGAIGDDTNGADRGAVHILRLNTNGTVKGFTKIASGAGSGPNLANSNFFGFSLASLGDLNGDGVADLAVGATGDDTGGTDRGALYVLLMNADGTVKNSTKIAHATGGGPTLEDIDVFGFSIAAAGDLDNDGMIDLAVGAFGDNTGGTDRGAVHILNLAQSEVILIPQADGFTVEFARTLDPTSLNLYDQGNALGPTDVTLTGATSGALRGSLVIDPSNRKLNFVASSGILSPDTYTVRLFSSANALQDNTGRALDGNSDGTPGDDFVGDFTVSAPAMNAVTVSLPKVTRGPGQPVNLPANVLNAGIPLTLSRADSVASLRLELRYDPNLLNLTAFTLSTAATTAGATATLTFPAAGVAKLSVNAPGALSSNSGAFALGSFTASVPATATYGAQHVLDVRNIILLNPSAQSVPAQDDDGLHVAAFFGDTNGNRSYTSGDVTLMQRLIVGINSGLSAFRLTDPLIVSDINASSSFTSADVTLLQRFIVGTPITQIPPLPPAPIIGLNQATLSRTTILHSEVTASNSTSQLPQAAPPVEPDPILRRRRDAERLRVIDELFAGKVW